MFNAFRSDCCTEKKPNFGFEYFSDDPLAVKARPDFRSLAMEKVNHAPHPRAKLIRR